MPDGYALVKSPATPEGEYGDAYVTSVKQGTRQVDNPLHRILCVKGTSIKTLEEIGLSKYPVTDLVLRDVRLWQYLKFSIPPKDFDKVRLLLEEHEITIVCIDKADFLARCLEDVQQGEERDSMKRVKLEYEHGVTISDEAFEQIAVIVKSNRVCETCEKPYTQERPQVSLNKCLPCFLRFHQSQFLTYVGVLEEREDYTVYGFLNPLGYIYPSFSNTENRDLNLSNAYTLKYYGYPVPSQVSLES